MNEANIKADLFEKQLEIIEFNDVFKRLDMEDAVGFQALQNMDSSRCKILVIFSNNYITTVDYSFYNFDNLDKLAKREQVLNKLNNLNIRELVLKYYIRKLDVMARFSYITPNEEFNITLFTHLLLDSYSTIKNDAFPEVMKIIWGS